VQSVVEVTKSSIDEPYRTAPVYITFGHGVDDVRANLQWFKEVSGAAQYNPVGKSFTSLERAILEVEDNDLEEELREHVIRKWEEIEEKFRVKRKPKKRR